MYQGVPLVYVPLEVIMSKYYGESERLLGKVFSLANELSTGAIIFLDEVKGLVAWSSVFFFLAPIKHNLFPYSFRFNNLRSSDSSLQTAGWLFCNCSWQWNAWSYSKSIICVIASGKDGFTWIATAKVMSLRRICKLIKCNFLTWEHLHAHQEANLLAVD